MEINDDIPEHLKKVKASDLTPIQKVKMLSTQFDMCWQRLNFGNYAPVNLLHTHYVRTNRAYHNIDHVWSMTHTFMSQWPDMSDDDSAKIVIAILMHDIIYEVGADKWNNEAASAQLLPWMVKTDVSKESLQVTAEIMQAILATTHDPVHAEKLADWQKYLVDLDLWEIGADWDIFHANTGKIRQEYARYSDAEWTEGRLKFWTDLLARGYVFHNPYGMAVYDEREKTARENIAKEMAYLESFGKVMN